MLLYSYNRILFKNYIISFLFVFFFNISSVSSQCVSNQTFALTPLGSYSPGQVVTIDYTLGSFSQINLNWIIAFQINLGPGWTNLQPLTAPNGSGSQSGYWLWDFQNLFPSGLNFGPGWRFVNLGSNSNYGSNSSGPFIIRFRATVASTCTTDDLSVSINVYGDCLTGGWSNGACCSDPVYSIYNGVVQLNVINTPPINHN